MHFSKHDRSFLVCSTARCGYWILLYNSASHSKVVSSTGLTGMRDKIQALTGQARLSRHSQKLSIARFWKDGSRSVMSWTSSLIPASAAEAERVTCPMLQQMGLAQRAAIYLPVSKSSSPASPRPSSNSCLVTVSCSSFVNSACIADEADAPTREQAAVVRHPLTLAGCRARQAVRQGPSSHCQQDSCRHKAFPTC